MLFIRGNYFIPDARKFWIKPSVEFLKSELDNSEYDAIITTGPPHSLHLIGLKLQKRTGLNWIADFRDPWTQIGYHEKLKLNRSSRQKHEKLESEVLNSADHIITTSFTTRKEFLTKTKKPVTVITNGFDAAINEVPVDSRKFQIAHIGSLLSGRNPKNLWKALSELVEEQQNFRENFELRLAGKVSEEVLESISTSGLDKFLTNEGYVNHSRAIEMQKKASVLLLIEIDSEETKGIIPGKLFEYLAAKRSILAIGPEDWDAEKIISETGAGSVHTYGDIQGIKEQVLQLFHSFLKGESIASSHNLEQYHRKTLTGKLAKLIKHI